DLLKAFVSGDEIQICESCEALEMPAVCRGEEISVEELKYYKICNCNDCGAKCQMLAKVQENCLLGTEPNKEIRPFTGCPRGRSYRYTFMTADRLRYPMERRGKRGEGLFRRLSWEETAQKIAEEIRSTGERFGPGSRYVANASGVSASVRGDKFIRRLMDFEGGYLDSYNFYSATCLADMMELTYGDTIGGMDIDEHLKAELVILWGHNPVDNQYGPFHNHMLTRIKEQGTPIVVIDPRVSETVLTLADEWIPIKPSSDPAMLDAMCYVIWREGLQDQEFMDKFCVGFDEAHMPEGVDPSLCYRAYLFGEKDGIVKTPQWAEEICGVPAEKIEDLAIRFAKAKPGCLMPGLGPQRTGCGEQTARGFMALCCLCGTVGKAGGGSGGTLWPYRYPTVSQPEYNNPYPVTFPSFLWTRTVDQPEIMDKSMGVRGADKLETGVKLIFSLANGQSLNQHSNINETIRMYQNPNGLEMLVFSNIFMTPAAWYADMVLPAKSFLEQDNIVPPWDPSDYFLCNNHCMDGLFEWQFEFDWINRCADILGHGEEFRAGKETADEWLEYLYNKLATEEPSLKPYNEFKERAIHIYPKDKPFVAFEENIKEGKPFNTPSGKIEIFSMRLYDMGDPINIPPIPGYIDSYEGPRDPKKAEYPLQLFAYHTRRRAHSIGDNNVLLEEVDPPRVWVNAKDAEARGIANGDRVEVFNERGVVRTNAYVSERIMQGTIALSEGVWYKPGKDGIDERGCINVLTHTVPTPYSHANPQHTNLADVRKI
ncbi:MAG: molybdopterin-dependent oxidoreductase, partial [Clostridia bacterium]|nr:molybdopterin-dependent oxidoreductase [Clostridia bacterium]